MIMVKYVYIIVILQVVFEKYINPCFLSTIAGAPSVITPTRLIQLILLEYMFDSIEYIAFLRTIFQTFH